MITYFDLIQKDSFREFVSKRIANNAEEPYLFPSILPRLYKYRSLSSYALDQIVDNKLTMTSIGEFNDVFDGAMHQYGSKKERDNAAEAKWLEWESLRVAAGLPEGLLLRESFVNPYAKKLKVESRLKFRELDYLGTYVCCFSATNLSSLMWAHYADSNKGICIEYEFDKLPSDNLLRNSIFPVAYTKTPIDLRDLIEDKQNKIYQYSLDAAVLCSALNKAHIWKYEQEWRFVWVLAFGGENERRLSINSSICPSKIYLGYHFLKPFFYYDFRNKSEVEDCEKILKKFLDFISFLQKSGILVAVMTPVIGSYHFKPCDISTDDLYGFMLKQFTDCQPKNMRYYYTIHDYLMDLIEKKQEAEHA